MSGRYARQQVLAEVGAAGQARLAAARVLVVGAGGLGCSVIQGLAGAGVGRLRIADPDRVEIGNLHRQPLYATADCGRPKVAAAAAWVARLTGEVRVEAHGLRVDPGNAPGLLQDVDVVVDAADSYAVTYTLSDLCRDRALPLVSAAVVGLSGHVGGFCGGGPSVRAVFPDLPADLRTCAEAGVLGPVVAVLGALQAQMTLALLLGLHPSPLGRLVTLDLGSLRFGGFGFAGAPEPPGGGVPFVARADLGPGDIVVDLRGPAEAPEPVVPTALRILPAEIRGWAPPAAGRIVLACRSGLRAWRAAEELRARGVDRLALLATGD